jgi:hypothetical protein
MIHRTSLLASALALSMTVAVAGCTADAPKTERWATTENTNVKINWDKVNEAYKAANGPEDLEKRINEIYEGDEVISIAVADQDAKAQVVTGFFDKDTNGQVGEGEKIFTVTRTLTGEGQAQLQTTGYGPFSGYASPLLGIMSGMALGSMMSAMFMPSYMPMYSQPYMTSGGRRGELMAGRSSYRAANPERFSKPSQTGRAYGGTPASSSSPARSRGGSRFGASRRAGPSPRLLLA